MLGLDRALEPLLPPLLALLDVPVDDAAWPTLDPPQRRRRTLEAVKRLLLRESQGQPLLLVFEDLHWIDEASNAMLAGLIESIAGTNTLALLNFRPEYTPPWSESPAYEAIPLAPLTLGTTARISMVRDPDGNWIELSQRASIVGSLT